MGGNAFKQIETKRLNRKEYLDIEKEIEIKILELFGSNSFHRIPFYGNKESFGDLDFVLQTEDQHWKTKIINQFNLKEEEYLSNGNVFSFVLKRFQIDCIKHRSDIIDAAVNYYAYNDLGNLLGRIFHKLGLKYGHDGLSLVLRSKYSENRVLKTIPLSKDMKEILSLLGLSYSEYQKGFESLEEIFAFVASSKFFDKRIFLLDNRNHKSKIRDKKRKTYNQFLEYCENIDFMYSFSSPISKDGRGGLKEPYYTDLVKKNFPWVDSEVKELYRIDEINQKFKEVYNGSVVSSLFNKEGKELGALMSKFSFSEQEKLFLVANPGEIKRILVLKNECNI